MYVELFVCLLALFGPPGIVVISILISIFAVDVVCYRPELVGDFNCDRIIKKLLEAELDGEMLSKQAALFADAADYLKAVSYQTIVSLFRGNEN